MNAQTTITGYREEKQHGVLSSTRTCYLYIKVLSNERLIASTLVPGLLWDHVRFSCFQSFFFSMLGKTCRTY